MKPDSTLSCLSVIWGLGTIWRRVIQLQGNDDQSVMRMSGVQESTTRLAALVPVGVGSSKWRRACDIRGSGRGLGSVLSNEARSSGRGRGKGIRSREVAVRPAVNGPTGSTNHYSIFS